MSNQKWTKTPAESAAVDVVYHRGDSISLAGIRAIIEAVKPHIADEVRNEAADNYYHGKVGNVRIWLREGAKNPYEHLKEEAE